MFGFKKKNNTALTETAEPETPRYPAPAGDPLTFPVIPPEQVTTGNILSHLKEGEPIWIWNPQQEAKKGLFSAFTRKFVGSFQGYYVYELKRKYLYKYKVLFEVMQGYEKISPFLKELSVWKMSDDVIEDWVQNDFRDAKAVHYDNQRAIDKAQRLQLKLTEDDIKRYLHTHDRLDITDDDFRKRGDK